MNTIRFSVARRIALGLGVAVFAMGVVHLLLQYLNLNVFNQQNGQIYELSNRFDLDDESSVPTWFSQALFLVISASAFLAAYLEKLRPKRLIWLGIALVTLVFSIDEIATLHEFTLQTIHVLLFGDSGPTGAANAWLVVLPFVGAAGLWLLWQMHIHLPRRTMLLFALAGTVFVVGAVGVDIITSTTARESFLNQGVMVAIEESFELVASIVVLYAVLGYLETAHGKRLSTAWSRLSAE